MLSKEEVADILKGYISQEAFFTYIDNSEKKFSELFRSVNS